MLFGKAERDYFIRKVGTSVPTESMNNIKRRYFLSQVTGNARENINSLETRWLSKVITDAGGTPSNTKSDVTLWKQAVIAIGKVPSNYIIDNKLKFYLNAP